MIKVLSFFIRWWLLTCLIVGHAGAGLLLAIIHGYPMWLQVLLAVVVLMFSILVIVGMIRSIIKLIKYIEIRNAKPASQVS